MASFLYPRTVAITRPNGQGGVGAQPYGGLKRTAETPIASNVPANIELQKARAGQEAKLPGDVQQITVVVIIPVSALARGVVQARDVVTDDAGVRYQVIYPDQSSLGYKLLCERAES